jgi:hypothetical protein
MTKTITPLLASILAALVLAATAGATSFGFAEDFGKYAEDGGASFFDRLHDLGMTENRIWVYWDPSRPDVIVEKPFLDRMLPVAEKKGVHVVFSVSPLKARGVTAPGGEARFVQFLVLLATTYPQVKDIIVGNEPNQPRFWQPQFVQGRPVAAAAYERVLARAYDALKALDPEIHVIGVGLSPRGNDRPKARNNVSRSPVRFIHELGVAYRASGRTKPIMDLFAFHPYPRFDRDPLTRGYSWPNAGMTQLDRIKQAMWDAFAGTAQPTFPETGAPEDADALRFALDEVGWQVQIPRPFRRAYTGRENVRTTAESTQAQIYRQIVDLAACDPSVHSLLFFHLIDERDLDRFQSGLIRADGSLRASYWTVKERIAQLTGEDGVQCPTRGIPWRHATSVAGAGVRFWASPRHSDVAETEWGFSARATEDARWEAELLPVDGPEGLSAKERTALSWPETSKRGTPLESSGSLRAYVSTPLAMPTDRLVRGWYVRVVRLSAAMNPDRTTLFVSPAFRAGA